MSEKWETEFFEWKDEIESKFNNLSQKNTELEKKFEEIYKSVHGIEPSEVDGLKEQIAELNELKEEFNEHLHGEYLLLEVLRNSIHTSRNAFLQIKAVLRESDLLKASTVADSYKEQLEKLDFKSICNDPIVKKCQEKFKEMEKQAEKKECDHKWVFHLRGLEKCERCGRFQTVSYKEDLSGEKDVSEVDETGGATPTRNVELDTSSLLGDDSKPLDPVDDEGFVIGNTLPKGVEFYELYLKDKEQYYFKKITHPFTELNNMVHLGMGMKLTPYDAEEKLIEGFIKVLKAFECGCGDGFDLQIIKEYEGMLNK